MSNDYDDREFDQLEEQDYIDIDATVEALRAAWKCVPTFSLSQLLDEVTPMPFCELRNDELIDALNEFILQNQ